MKTDELLNLADGSSLVFDQLEPAIIGIDHNGLIVYSYALMSTIFEKQGMTPAEAHEWIDYNVIGTNGGAGFTILMYERTKYDA